MFGEDRLKPGAVSEESFALYMDPTSGDIMVTDPWVVTRPTVSVFVEETTCWALAARKETVYTAYQKGLPLRVEGQFKIRDMELVDEIMDLCYRALESRGKDLAQLFSGAV